MAPLPESKMTLEEAKATIQHALESYEGECWDTTQLEELLVYVEQQEKEKLAWFRAAMGN